MDTTDFDKVRAYYSDFDEWSRLDSPAGRLEFMLSIRHLEKHLAPKATVLDLGGGPGRYAIALAEGGHRTWLAELSPVLVAEAERRVEASRYRDNVIAITQANATDLATYGCESFDAVVALGPFYHLTTQAERQAAAREIGRVLAKGGLVFAAFIPRWTGLSGLIERAAACPKQVSAASFRRAFETGVFENEDNSGFQEGFYAFPEEMQDLFRQEGFEHVETVAVQGLAAGNEAELQRIEESNPELCREVLAVLDETSRDECIVAYGGHCIYTGRKAQ